LNLISIKYKINAIEIVMVDVIYVVLYVLYKSGAICPAACIFRVEHFYLEDGAVGPPQHW
jgi:hypothetical protein